MPFHRVFGIEYLVSSIWKPLFKNTEYKILNTKYRKSAGFTLIELLIVITIIGILASLTLTSFANAQQKARDGVRKSDLGQLKRAMELAKADCQGNAYYPYMASTTTFAEAKNAYMNGTSSLAPYLSNTALKYLSSNITDPKNDSTYYYAYFNGSSGFTANVCPDTSGTFTQSGHSNYALVVLLERATDNDGVKSREKCKNKPGPGADPNSTDWTLATYAGYYVVCN